MAVCARVPPTPHSTPLAAGLRDDAAHQLALDGLLLDAVARGDVAAAELFMDRGADPDGAYAGPRPLVTAAFRRDERMMRLLLSRGADIDCHATGGVATPLMAAVATNDLAAVVFLLGQCADPDVPDCWGFTALSHALSRGCSNDIVDALIEHGADARAHGVHGFAPMHFAAARGNVYAMIGLARRGASPDDTCASGHSAMDVAALFAPWAVARLVKFSKARDCACCGEVESATWCKKCAGVKYCSDECRIKHAPHHHLTCSVFCRAKF